MSNESSQRESTDSAAYNLAQTHGARPLSVDGYHQTVELCGRVACGWLFRYRIICSLDIPAYDQESFAGAVGCLVADDGEIRDLSGPMFIDMLHMLA
jgi:hypothetical protein